MNISLENCFFDIIVIGTGGTGGNYLRDFGRYLYSLPVERKSRIRITIVDGDTVEKRNIGRQPFSVDDVGENKAVAMAVALEDVFELMNVRAVPAYLEQAEQIKRWTDSDSNTKLTLLIGCVDNHHARKVMHEYFKKFSKHPSGLGLFYLDAANEYSVGEVVTAISTPKGIVAPDRKYYYPNMFRGKLKRAAELSCQEMNEISPQHIVTNVMAANLLLVQTVQIISGEFCSCGGITYFDSMKQAVRFVEWKGSNMNNEEGKCS